MAKCKVEQTTSERRSRVRRGTGENPKYTNIVNMTAESLNFWFTKFVEEVCKEDGERYPLWNAEFTVCGSVLYICDFLYWLELR